MSQSLAGCFRDIANKTDGQIIPKDNPSVFKALFTACSSTRIQISLLMVENWEIYRQYRDAEMGNVFF